MCLSTKNKNKKKAEHGIVCYKVLSAPSWAVDVYCTPIYQQRISKKYVGSGKYIYPSTTYEVVEPRKEGMSKVCGGFIHSFEKKSDAFDLKEKLSESKVFSSLHVFECRIPRLHEYYEGKDEDGKNGYASKAIKIVKEVNIN